MAKKIFNKQEFEAFKGAIAERDLQKVLFMLEGDINVMVQYRRLYLEMEEMDSHTNALTMAIHQLSENNEGLGFIRDLIKCGAKFDLDIFACYNNSPLHKLYFLLTIGRYEVVDGLINEGFDINALLNHCKKLQISGWHEPNPAGLYLTKESLTLLYSYESNYLPEILFWLSRGLDFSIISDERICFEKLKEGAQRLSISWDEPFKGGPSLASAEEVYKAKMEAVRAAEREKKKQKVATVEQEKKDFLKSVIIEKCDSLGVNEEKLNEAAIILLNSETKLHGIDLLFSHRLSERGIVDPKVQEFFNYFIKQSRDISYNKDCKELIRLLTEVYEERRVSSQAQQKASPDELLELPVELEPEVPLESSAADIEAKADPEYLGSLIAPSAAENTEPAAAAEPYVDSVNPIEVAGHVDIPDLP